jgi:DNA-directed RNA polymerase subunit omega
MARITIEDCMEQVPNRFHLVQMASIRAKQLKKGARPLLSSEENKHVVMALREIAAGLVKPGDADPAASMPDPVFEAAPSAEGQAPGAGASDASDASDASPETSVES